MPLRDENTRKGVSMVAKGVTNVNQQKDSLGNPLDPIVGYARGRILKSSVEETLRHSYAKALVRKRMLEKGRDSFFNFTGHRRNYLVSPEQIPNGEEWVGPAAYWQEIEDMARDQFGGNKQHEVAVFNRATAGIVATCLALVNPESYVVSVIPGARSHPSIIRGVQMAGAKILPVRTPDQLDQSFSSQSISLVVITGVNSELEVIDQDLLLKAIRAGKSRNIPVFLDDAYGTRLRPIIFGRPKTMQTGADLGITACDKAGMSGPRAGLMVGRADLMEKIISKAAELGLEARSPIALGVWASLREFDPEHLRQEVEYGKQIYHAACERFGPDRVKKSPIGASFSAETICEMIYQIRPRAKETVLVPAEITAGLGMHWLGRYGIITVNALGQPGASIWLRLKPNPAELDRFGGVKRLMDTLEDSLSIISEKACSLEEMKFLILGA